MREPASVSPIFSITTGLALSLAAWSALRNCSADLKPSTYAPITCVPSSYAKYSRKSPNSRSTSLPVGTHREERDAELGSLYQRPTVVAALRQ